MILSDIKDFFSFLSPSNVKKWFGVENLFVNYFWFYTIFSISFLFLDNETLYNVGFPIILILLLYKKSRKISVNIIDLLWMLELLWIFITWVLNDYPHKFHLMLIGISREIAFMLAYWIARFSKMDYLKTIISNARKPLVIGCLFGLYCLLYPPEWYIKRVEEALYFFYNGHASSSAILEQFRLRSFYRSSYAISYMCTMSIVYELFNYNKNHFFKRKSKTKYVYLYVILLIITSALCMMRAPILCWMIGVFVFGLYYYATTHFSGIVKNRNNRKVTDFLTFLIPAILLCFYFYSYMDSDSIGFLLGKFNAVIENKEDFIEDRFFLQAQSFTLFGEGFAKYNIATFYKFGLTCIADGEYVKIIAEQGFVGLAILLTMFIIGLLKAAFNFKHLYYELFIIIMLLICMIGADPLSIPDKHCFIYWLALGQISRYISHRSHLKYSTNS